MKAQSQWCPVFICSYSDWTWQLQSENTATKLWFLNWKVTNRASCKSSGATWFVWMKEFAELEPILSGVRLPRGRVCFNVAALRSGSKAQQRWKPGKQVSRGSWGTDGVVCHSLLKAKWWRSLMVPCFQQRDLRPSAKNKWENEALVIKMRVRTAQPASWVGSTDLSRNPLECIPGVLCHRAMVKTARRTTSS